ncbi:hypothetical protein G9C98_002313 [Cotesia typhae]|uniref:Protein kinase domain-containing protein n=1 Tax=Cotesia typhae TaxID=2053667 RepID=A0A8J5UX70_9HYME|nr:hypothetical protein G9C98_002313 [Cotesia typhae]
MSYLRGSANYVWCTTSVLGKGATGAVFQGVDKNNGEPVAVKTFNSQSQTRPIDVQMREFQVLKKVKHENIVKLLAIEEEQDGRGKVIVMELCTGGSLFNILDDPENTYGLAESEFLLVLEHLCAGMKHLRDNNLVHRDLKPGNIMKYIADDGSTIYKLTDFGAARELNEDQQFFSLYGTEEYLHPDVYERAVLRKPVNKTFGATVDLWSIGVTLYHVATGNLPFRPFGGRRNKETMYFITTRKDSGVISGVQAYENAPIEWSKELPNNCRLSYGLKKIVTPLLAGLLEVNKQYIWSFERFFNQVTDILCRKAIHVFNFHTMQSLQAYLHPEDKLSALKAHIQEQTDILPHAQIILFGETLLSKIIDENRVAKGFPVTTIENPFSVFSRENNNVVSAVINGLGNLQSVNSSSSSSTTGTTVGNSVSSTLDGISAEPNSNSNSNRDKKCESIVFPVFANLVSVENDASQAKLACSVGHSCKRTVDRLAIASKLSQDSVNAFVNLLSSELKRLTKQVDHLRELTKAVEKIFTAAERGDAVGIQAIKKFSNSSSVPHSVGNESKSNEWGMELHLRHKQLFSELAPAIAQLYQRYVKDEVLKAEWESTTRQLTCPWKTKASQRASTLVDRLRDGWQHLLRDRATLQRSESLADWYKMVQTIYLQSQILDKDLRTYNNSLESFACRMSQESNERYETLSSYINTLPTKQLTSQTSNLPDSIREEGTKMWRNICDMQQQIALILCDNDLLVDKINNLTINKINSDNTLIEFNDSEKNLTD